MKPSEGFEQEAPSVDHRADLAWLDCLVEREILRLRARYELSLDELRGLYISDRQVDQLLCDGAGGLEAGPAQRLSQKAQGLRAARSDDTPLAEMAGRFALSSAERDVLLLALAPELALRYESLYAYLNNDVGRRYLTVDLALRLLEDSGVSATRALLAPGSRLFEAGLLEPIDVGERRSSLAQGVALAPPLAQYLLGLPLVDPRLPADVRVLPREGVEIDTEALSSSARKSVEDFAGRHLPRDGLIVCIGESPGERLAAVRLYAARHDRPVVALPLSALGGEAGWSHLRQRLGTLTMLARAVLLLNDEQDNFPQEPGALLQLRRQVYELATLGIPLVWAVPSGVSWPGLVADLPFVELVLPTPDSEDRAERWRVCLARGARDIGKLPIEALAERFALSGSRIAAAAQAALRASEDSSPEELGQALWRAARRHSGQSLAQLASRVVKPHTWQHLVLPPATLRQVREIATAIARRERVFHQWRLAERTGRGDGLMCLFTGASGTGKTMTAAVIANDLGLDLYRIDLASVVSKYIGETEKNLDRIFLAARDSNAILLFDEADALLGKRSEVKDAHDRYANIEVAYLLQKMEEHDGSVILASNLPKNLDQAFARRMHFVVEFPRPDAVLRERLWRGMFPPEAPLAADIDFAFLARQFETSGGEIQMIALDAAFLASAEDSEIGMAHLVKAMARQQLKQGNPAGMSGFKQYHGLARRTIDTPRGSA